MSALPLVTGAVACALFGAALGGMFGDEITTIRTEVKQPPLRTVPLVPASNIFESVVDQTSQLTRENQAMLPVALSTTTPVRALRICHEHRAHLKLLNGIRRSK